MQSEEIKKIKELAEDFFRKMTINAVVETKTTVLELEEILKDEGDKKEKDRNVVDLVVRVDDPQILIGENGQTLMETQRILRMFLSKKMQKDFHLNLDINDYKKKKTDYLKGLAQDLAGQVASSREPKILSPMSSFERRIIHAELAGRTDIKTESEGQEPNRRVIIRPK
jgi:spoIIIJ-associated protein